MARQKNDKLKHDLLVELARPALQALSAAGYTRLDQFTKIKDADLLKLHGMGPKADGRSFADPD